MGGHFDIRSNERQSGDSQHFRPLVPEFSENWLSCWFALLSVPACYMVFPAIRLLLFRNCSEILTIDSNDPAANENLALDTQKRITVCLLQVELMSPESVPKTVRGVLAWPTRPF